LKSIGTQHIEILNKLDQLYHNYEKLINVMWVSRVGSEELEDVGRTAMEKKKDRA
jgi:hypothetical protein